MDMKYSENKINGATFTPIKLANFLADRLLSYLGETKENVIQISDPACGDGTLLEAIANKFPSNFPIKLYGYDTNSAYLKKAQCLLSEKFPNFECKVELKDYIQERFDVTSSDNKSIDIYIANPPYVRTQILGEERSKAIANLYQLRGRIDLYFPFLINMTDSLKEGGLMGVITSNRYLTTKSGADIRRFLLSHYDILEVIDLGDTKLFDAAVLPAIFIGRKNTKSPHTQKAKFLKIYETKACENAIEVDSIYSILNMNQSNVYKADANFYELTLGYFSEPQDKNDIWKMNTREENTWIKTIQNNSQCTIGDLFKVRVGVKSCADEIFFSDDWDNIEKPESVFFRNIISQKDISQWNINKELKSVIYPYVVKNGKKSVLDISKYPKALSFFILHQNRLESRTYLTKSKRKWYEYWVPQNPLLWTKPKIVFADISAIPRFGIDRSGAIVNGNCYWMVAEHEEQLDLLYLVAAIANSPLMEKYHDLCFNNKLYNGRRRYLAQYVEKYPIPYINASSKKIVLLVKEMLKKESLSPTELLSYSSQINLLVEKAFELG